MDFPSPSEPIVETGRIGGDDCVDMFLAFAKIFGFVGDGVDPNV